MGVNTAWFVSGSAKQVATEVINQMNQQTPAPAPAPTPVPATVSITPGGTNANS